VNAATITSVTTVRPAGHPNLLWVLVDTDDGLRGVGETFFMAETVAAYVNEVASPYLLGQDARDIHLQWRALYRQWQRRGIGAEARGASAIDVALWDLMGRRTGLPLHELLGGAMREAIPAYNTCAGPGYLRTRFLPGDPLYGEIEAGGRHEDLWATWHDPGGLARSLRDEGFRAMKVFPFDPVADESGGQLVTPAGLERGLEAFAAIRAAVGDDMEVALELRARWTLPAAKAIARAAEPYRPAWIEDPIRNDSVAALAELARATTVPLAIGENLGSRHAYRELLESGAAGIVLSDPLWCGGVTEARRIADLAAMYERPYAPHDCTGPVGLAVGVHLCLHAETALWQEVVRAYLHGYYGELADGVPLLDDGLLRPAPRPGHGVEPRPEALEDPAALVRRSTASAGDVPAGGRAFL